MSRDHALDGIRGLGALGVFAFHASLIGPRPLGPGGVVGVEVFFVLSGYLITGLLAAEVRRHGRIDLARFLRRRAARLYPALLVACAVTLVLVPLTQPTVRADTLREVPLSLTCLTDVALALHNAHGTLLDHTWFLSVEEQFYLVWPLVLLLVVRFRRPARLLLVLAVLAALGAALAARSVPGYALYFSPLGHLSGLIVGGAAGLSGLRDRRLAALGVLALISVAVLSSTRTVLTDCLSWRALSLSLAAGAVALLLIGLRSPGGPLRAVLSQRWLSDLGQRSYGFYLLQQPLLFGLHAQVRAAVAIPLALVLTLVLSRLSWRYVELPLGWLLSGHGSPRPNPAITGTTVTGPATQAVRPAE